MGGEVQNAGPFPHSHDPLCHQAHHVWKGPMESGSLWAWWVFSNSNMHGEYWPSFLLFFWGLLMIFLSWSCPESVSWLLLPRGKWEDTQVPLEDREGLGPQRTPQPRRWVFSGEQWRITRGRRRWQACFQGDTSLLSSLYTHCPSSSLSLETPGLPPPCYWMLFKARTPSSSLVSLMDIWP